MEPTYTASIERPGIPLAVILARWLLGLLVLISVVRAMTQPVTPEEAWNYDRYIGSTWKEAFSRFDVNNHVLNTLLVRTSTARIHLTELSLRLPSLLAGILYLLAVYRLARRWFGDGAVFLAVVCLLACNPLVVDGLSEARGYGMALSAWTWALCLILEAVQQFSGRKLNLAGMCLGLSVAASLAFAAPACALLLISALWFGAEGRQNRMAQIAFLTLFVLLVIPLNHAEWATLGVGAGSLRQTLLFLSEASFGISMGPKNAAIPLAAGCLAMGGAIAAFRRAGRRQDALIVFAGAVLPLLFVMLLGAHRYFHTPFPREGSVFLAPLIILLLSSMILKWNSKVAKSAYLVLCGILMLRYFAVSSVGNYRDTAQFSGGRILAKSLRRRAGTAAVRVAVSQDAETVLRYYRSRYRQSNWELSSKQLDQPYDYYVLTTADSGLIGQRHLHVMWRDRGLTLAGQ